MNLKSKFTLMGAMLFCLLFVQAILSDTKDAILVNAPCSGVEVLPFVKGMLINIASISFTALYVYLSSKFCKYSIYRMLTTGFILFFVLFAFVMQPNTNLLHMSPVIMEAYQKHYPALKWFVPLIGNWTYSLYYIMAEMWGVMMVSMLFWQLANGISNVSDAKKNYALWLFIGNMGFVAAGQFLMFISRHIGSTEHNNNLTLQIAVCSIVLMYSLFLLILRILEKSGIDLQNKVSDIKKKEAPKYSFFEIIKSREILTIFAIVFSYGVCINILESIWKYRIAIASESYDEYAAVMGKFSSTMGIASMIMMLVSSALMQKMKWIQAALIAPITFLLTSCALLFVVVSEDINDLISGSVVISSVIVGLGAVALCKSTKFSFADPSKEMLYINLSEEFKTKGKAFVDVFGASFGKSSGAYIQIILLTVFYKQTMSDIMPFLFSLLFLAILCWLYAIYVCRKSKSAIRS